MGRKPLIAGTLVTIFLLAGAPTGSSEDFGYVPLWPFASQQEADRWLAQDAPRGVQAWHRDPAATAASFTRNYLGFSQIDRVIHVDDRDDEAWVDVGYTLPNGKDATAATIHLVRYGTDPAAAWEVVGSEDTSLQLTSPAYGNSVGPVVTAGGEITGVDESVHIQVRQSTKVAVLGEYCCVQTGGDPGSWSAQVPVTGAAPGPLTMVAWTGGHVADVEKFAVTGLHAH
ncbi:hypothetical protein [Mycolicibacterium sp. 120270]|uniref:hypothetical protein n=1 Tax=Mycolicibacterium sp. 120270 TaxID=3090600 RepID=UPI00299E4A06|nr:hypothetical protein [Mycolicibacterium sp. 120270]MDX1886335.1 hypothetical protein [Mycolicibacterium sp. 120270]